MKHFLIFLCLLASAMLAKAQDLAFLKGQRVTVEINYSDCAINGYDESTIMDFEGDWMKDQPVLFQKFIEPFNETLDGAMVGGKFSKCRYVIELYPTMIAANGNMYSFLRIHDNEKAGTDNLVYQSTSVYGKGGTFGSFLNLVGDGMRSSGKQHAKLLRRLMKGKK